MFAVINREDQTAVFVKRGETGYWPCAPADMEAWAAMYRAQGEAVTRAATVGSLFGWDVAGAAAAREPS